MSDFRLSTEEILAIYKIKISEPPTEEEIAKFGHAQAQALDIVEAYDTFSKQLNYFHADEEVTEVLLKAVVNDHRTLQQSFFRMLLMLFKKYSKLDPSRFVDLRNQGAHEASKEITKLEDSGVICFPYV